MDGNDLYTESVAARILTEAMAEHGFEQDDISIAVEGETDFAEAVSAVVRRMDEMEAMADAAKALAARYTERASVLALRRERLREALSEALERSGVPLPLRRPEGSVTLTSPAPSALVIDEAQIPEIYWRTKVTKSPDLRSITLDLRDGKAVPGTTLRNARRSLSVRRA